MQREKLGSRLGFILLSAGCAIGIGNVWKFPYMVGQYGGGLFVLIYLFFLLVMGVPVLCMEFAVGRASQKSPIHMHAALVPEKKGWRVHGWASLAGNYLLMMFYTTVAGWMLRYFFASASGELSGLDAAGVAQAFTNIQTDIPMVLLFTVIVILIGFAVCSFSLQKGLERITKYMMLALLGIMVVLGINSAFLPGGKEGLAFYLTPTLDPIKEIGLGTVIMGAMSQAFFTLSLGIGSMAIFGSYLDKDRALLGESVNVALLDTFVALASGFIIFPACSAFGVEADSGPSLIFITLPNIFNSLPMGRLWGALFFLFLTFAAFSTVLAVFENIIACTMDLGKMDRKKACIISCALMLLLCLPCVLGFGPLSGFHPFGGTSNIMDLEDFLVSNLLLPLGSLAIVFFCVSRRYGWGFASFAQEANTGKGMKVQTWMRWYMSFVLPVLMAVFFVISLVNFFK